MRNLCNAQKNRTKKKGVKKHQKENGIYREMLSKEARGLYLEMMQPVSGLDTGPTKKWTSISEKCTTLCRYFSTLLAALWDVNIFWQFKFIPQHKKWVSVNKKAVHRPFLHKLICTPVCLQIALCYNLTESELQTRISRRKWVFLHFYYELTGRSVFLLLVNNIIHVDMQCSRYGFL